MASKITSDIIIEINEKYYLCKNYSKVAREIGLSPSTVKKYVQDNYIPIDKRIFSHVNIKEIEEKILRSKNDNKNFWLILSEEEKREIEELWKELSI